MKPEEHILLVSQNVDALDIKREELKLAEFRLYKSVTDALDSGIHVDILAEVCGCNRKTLYDYRKRAGVLLMQAQAKYASELAQDS